LSRELDSKLGEVSSSSDMSANHLLSSRSLRNKAPASNKSNKRKREEDHTLRRGLWLSCFYLVVSSELELGKNSLLRFFLLSLSLLCAEAKEDGWAQVTASTLQPRADVESNICEFKPWCVAPPEYFTAEAIFRHLFTGVISRLVQDMNASFKQRHQGPRDTKVRTTEHQMWALVAVLIRVMAEQKRLLKETVRDKEFASWNKLSIYVTERLSGAMVASYELLFAAFNHSLAAIVQAAGVACVNEAILSFKGRVLLSASGFPRSLTLSA
jgi:hypothetical protein